MPCPRLVVVSLRLLRSHGLPSCGRKHSAAQERSASKSSHRLNVQVLCDKGQAPSPPKTMWSIEDFVFDSVTGAENVIYSP
ncbi:MAG: hypothetical protein JWO80_383 [Bryobacterales bacterium]|nr:hypothetical protein [Bryobacterales bacterium]